MAKKNKATALGITADLHLEKKIRGPRKNVTNTIFFLHFKSDFSIFLEFFFLYKIVFFSWF
jgi:hypothetical protein